MEKDCFILPGLKPVLELLRDTPDRVNQVFCRKGGRSAELIEIQNLCHKNHVHCVFVESSALDRLCRESGSKYTTQHQGVVARLASIPLLPPEELLRAVPMAPLPVVIALDQVRDPGNVGTLARTAYALGCAGLLMPEHNSAFLGPAALRASAGALGRLPVSRATNLARTLDTAEELGFAIYGTGDGPVDSLVNPYLQGLTMPAVIVLGSEDKGLRPGVAKRCHHWLNIPFGRDFDSLNVAQAGAILLALAAAHKTRLKSLSTDSRNP